MSMDIEKYKPSGFTLALAERALPRDEPVPSKEAVAERLDELFTTLRGIEVEKTNALRDFVRTNDDWSVQPEGRKQAIDTCISGANGEAFHIQLTCERSRDLYTNESLTDEAIIEIIRAEATEFRVLFYDEVAMKYIHEHADPDESLLAKVRGYYKQNPNILPIQEAGTRSAFRRDPIDQFFHDGHHTAHMVPIEPVPVVDLVTRDVKSALSHAHVNRARTIAEAAKHGEEYRFLHHELDRGEHWPAEARASIVKRMLEIQAINGYDGHNLDWRTVLIPADDYEMELSKDDDAWDEHSIAGLRQTLASSAEMLVLEAKLDSRAVAAHTLKILQAPQ